MDNGPELIAWALRDWCRLAGTTTTYIEPGSPWENPFVESFNGRVRDELLNIEDRHPPRGQGRHRSPARRVQHLMGGSVLRITLRAERSGAARVLAEPLAGAHSYNTDPRGLSVDGGPVSR